MSLSKDYPGPEYLSLMRKSQSIPCLLSRLPPPCDISPPPHLDIAVIADLQGVTLVVCCCCCCCCLCCHCCVCVCVCAYLCLCLCLCGCAPFCWPVPERKPPPFYPFALVKNARSAVAEFNQTSQSLRKAFAPLQAHHPVPESRPRPYRSVPSKFLLRSPSWRTQSMEEARVVRNSLAGVLSHRMSCPSPIHVELLDLHGRSRATTPRPYTHDHTGSSSPLSALMFQDEESTTSSTTSRQPHVPLAWW